MINKDVGSDNNGALVNGANMLQGWIHGILQFVHVWLLLSNSGKQLLIMTNSHQSEDGGGCGGGDDDVDGGDEIVDDELLFCE